MMEEGARGTKGRDVKLMLLLYVCVVVVCMYY